MAGKTLKTKWLTTSMFLGAVFSALITFPMTTNAASQQSYKLKIPLGLDEEAFKVPQDNPFSPTIKNVEEGSKVYFGKGLCVKCHGVNGKGVEVPGHSPRNFTDLKWQNVRTDGEMMWVLKNGSPGTSMPIRVGKGISEEEGWKVILFIRTFAGV